jgi:tryptophan synthase beta chain
VVERGEALLEHRSLSQGGIELRLQFRGVLGFGGLLCFEFGSPLGFEFGSPLGFEFGSPLGFGGGSLLLAVEQRRPRSCGRDRTVPDYGEPIMASTVAHQIHLSEAEMPTQWYNLIADLPTPPPPALHPGTHQPAGPDDFAPLFPMALIEQEVTTERYIDIPGGVLDVYRLWRPSPLFRAHRLEALLDTPARIYYKYEGVSPAGSHKPNTAVPQAYYNHQEGITKLTTETGAGQWGTALAFATAQYGMECEIWQVAASYRQKPYRKTMMEIWGATLHSSPSELTEFGRSLLAENPDHPGSLGIAISEAVAMCVADPNARYALGSVLNHVLLHQTIIGEEALLQLAKVDEVPDVLVGCTGGGSNFGGLAFPFLREKLAGKMNPTIRCVEPAACPTLTKGEYRYDFGDTAGMTPLMKMHTLGHTFIPEPIHAGGLRYHGMSPLVSHVYNEGLVEAIAIPQRECFAGALQFARTEGIVPAPEPTHAIAAAIREALACKESGEEKVILTALCGHGHLDLASYETYLSGEMVDYDLPDSVIADAMASVPVIA